MHIPKVKVGAFFMKKKDEQIEDVTKYGEFISSYFSWVPLEKQKQIVEKLENITKKNN